MQNTPLVAVVMGSHSDKPTMDACTTQLAELNIPYHCQIISAHRTPDLLFQFAEQAKDNGLQVIIAGAGGAAHLPGMLAAKTVLPVIGVPIQSQALNGIDSLLSIVQMPAGIPVATTAIGKPGANNAALLAAAILGNQHQDIANRLAQFRQQQTANVLNHLSVEQS